MNAEAYLNVTARLAYYDAMKISAPARAESARPASSPRIRRRLFQKRQQPVILVPEGNLHA